MECQVSNRTADERMKIIRVFPRRTLRTPRDDFAFVGDPPMDDFRPDADEVHVSVTFTWDIKEGKRLAGAWQQYYPIVKLGGPAFSSPVDDFTPGIYICQGVTFTTRGCNKRCPDCLVPEREGRLRLLEIQPGYIIQDNNLLQAPRAHITKVFDMLKKQRHAAVFAGGLDTELIGEWFAAQLRGVRVRQVFMAADSVEALEPLARAAWRLRFLGRERLRCYAMIGQHGETLEEAEARLKEIYELGCLPFAQLYQPPDKYIKYPGAWKRLAKVWSRPALTKTRMRTGHDVRCRR